MSHYSRVRRQQLIREAEGYVDFMTMGDEGSSLSQPNLDLLGHRALAVLAQLDPQGGQRAHALYLTGLVYRSMFRYSDAIEPLVAAGQLDPTNSHVWLTLAWCYKRIQRVDLAVDSMREAIQNGGDDAILHYNLACYLSLLGDVTAAVRELAQAFELEPAYRERVASESDFDAIRNQVEFDSLLRAPAEVSKLKQRD